MLYASHRQTGPHAKYWRYWRFTFTASLISNLIEINEITMLFNSVNQIPLMTGPTTGGVTITADTYQATLEPWEVGDGDAADELKAWGSTAGLPVSLNIDFGAGNEKIFQSYTITARNNANQYWPKDWTLNRSRDGVAYEVADTRAGVTFAQGETKSFTI